MRGSILQWNCRSLRAQGTSLRALLGDKDRDRREIPSFVCLQELKIADTNRNMGIGSNYITYTKLPNPVNPPRGGVMIAVENSIPHREILINTQIQAVAVEVYEGKLKSICSIYLPPGEDPALQDLQHLLSRLPRPTLIVGDFNAHNPLWHDQRTDPRGRMIEEFARYGDLAFLDQDSPTFYRLSDQITSHIDLALIDSSCALDYDWMTDEQLHGSDHYPIFITPDRPAAQDVVERWNLGKADWEKYEELSEITEEITSFDTIEEGYEHLIWKIECAAEDSIPKYKNTGCMRPSVPWWNKKCVVQRRAVRAAFRQMKANPNPTTTQTYKRQRAKKTKLYNEERKDSFRKYISSLTARTPSAEVWEKIRKLKGNHKRRPRPALETQGGHITGDPAEVAEIFGEHFSRVSAHPSQRFIPSGRNPRGYSYNQEYTMRELEDALGDAEGDSSPGEDGIYNVMLKNLSRSAKMFMLALYNRIWTEGHIPAAWHSAIVIPIHKKGKTRTEAKSYRPISLTSTICKIFEKMVNSRLMWYLESEKKLSKCQYGFRPNRSTMDPIASLTTNILNGFAERRNTAAIFFDLEKAFDTVDRGYILKNLQDMGIHEQMLTFIQNYLSDRNLKVRMGNHTSRPFPTYTGVPQGSTLSATCFLAAIDSIAEVLSKNIKFSLYADDMVISYTSTDALGETSVRLLQESINNLQREARTMNLSFSAGKTVMVHFQKRKKRHPEPPVPLRLNNEEIEMKKSVRFLGMILDCRLNWMEHIRKLKADISKALNLMRVVARVNYGADRQTMKKLYWATIESRLGYGSMHYSSANPLVLKMLNSVQNEASRIMTGAFRTSPVDPLLVEADNLPLDLRREELCLKYLLRLESSKEYKRMNVMETGLDREFEEKPNLSAPFGPRARLLKEELQLQSSPLYRGPAPRPP